MANIILLGTSFLPPAGLNLINKKVIFDFNYFAMAEPEINTEEIVKKVKSKVAVDTRVTLFDIKVSTSATGITASGKVLNANQKQELINALNKLGKVEDKVENFPFSEMGELAYGLANLPVMNIREKPKHSAWPRAGNPVRQNQN